MTLTNVFQLVGGLALFLFGMGFMGDGLKRLAGNRLESTLYKLTSTPLRGVLLGTGVTAVIQSSSATSCMVVGFVNSGMMKLTQAIGIIMGANIGTSATGWILCLNSLDGNTSGPWWTQLLSTTFISAVIALVGVVFRMLAKDDAKRHLGDLMLGFSVLMFGMSMMSGSVSGLKESPSFQHMMTTFSNPALGVIVGVIITAVLQSSSASVGILQMLSATGTISFSTALPIIMGMNIGASVPVLLSAIGATKDGKRTSLIYLIFNVLGTLVCSLIFYTPQIFVEFGFTNMFVDSVDIAFVNTVYKVASTIVLFPFVKSLEKLVCVLIKSDDSEEEVNELDRLEERFLSHPAVAIEQSKNVLSSMVSKTQKNFLRSISLLYNYDAAEYKKLQDKEAVIDKYEDGLGTYLVKLTGLELSRNQSRDVSKFLHTVGDVERIADHAVNISHVAKEINVKKLVFSEEAQLELNVLSDAVIEIVRLTSQAFINSDTSLAYRVEPLEEWIDILCDELKLRHINRVQKGNCSLTHGFVFSDLLTDYERIADHCSNVAVALIELDLDVFDPHEYLNTLKQHKTESFNKFFSEYKEQYALI